ncbi:MAG: hypothetical protein HY673_18950 [Chloroflexi bacterium]|nr:hypothetical protein [Chloroflexota bacterium]
MQTPSKLSEKETRPVEELRRRDAKVRAHKKAHQAAAGRLALGRATFTYQKGPGGRVYAIGGSRTNSNPNAYSRY